MSEAVAPNGNDGSDRRRHSRGAERQDALAQPAAVRRPRGDRLDRLYGPRQFRHQHPGRREIRLCAAVGRADGQCHRHAVPGAVGQARHRHRAQSGRNVPRAFSAARRLCLVDRQRSGGDGDRPRRIPRRRHRSVAAVAHPAGRRHGRHGRADLRHSDVRRAGVSPDRTHHRRARRRHRALLSRRNVHRADRLGRGGRSAASFRDCRTPAR